ncbi:DNA polymerase III subunit delta [Vibrio sp. SM6]|uniref:DNA polymerase III subunit delta n=1 Tax=Vibrio agarilyticus TaxID=2726741 RepID=A0A7X8TTA7_9VIBR|nr:DNA polymerase III subunit delta [Vibrio agarilyticus]NLS14177.1 DNA polymerase III subunit delta [Vibrio agarilyticus]
MRVFAERLHEQLAKGLRPLYLVFGNELLLLQESRDAIASAAKQQGFDERHRFTVDTQFDWQAVWDCTQALSLFSTRQLIEIELPDATFNANITQALTELPSRLNPDVLVVLIGQKLTKAQENTKWFKALNQDGLWVSCLTPDLARLPQFVQQRCTQLGLKPDRETLQMLAQWHEGNLLALSQSLEKLALLYPDGELTLLRVENALSRHNHFTAFHWIDALLAGKASRAERILRQLNAEGVEAVILLRTIQKELKQLMAMQRESQQMPLPQVYEKYRVWQNKRPLYHAALTRLPLKKLQRLTRLLAQAEVVAKTDYEQSVWPLVHQLSIEMCIPDIALG